MATYLKNRVLYIFIFILFSSLFACSPSIGENILREIASLETDAAIIDDQTAYFIFDIQEQSEWEWYQPSTELNSLEYGWWADFVLNDNSYSCGYRLFKNPFSGPAKGSFKQFIEAGQVDFSSHRISKSDDLNENTAILTVMGFPDRDARVSYKAEPGRLIVMLSERAIVRQLNSERPDSITFYKMAGTNRFEGEQVFVRYLTDDS